MNHLYYLDPRETDAHLNKSGHLPARRPALEELLDETEDHPPTRLLTFEDLYALWLVFREVGSYVDEDAVTLPDFARWILNDKCEVTW